MDVYKKFQKDNIMKDGKFNYVKMAKCLVKFYKMGITRLEDKRILFIANQNNKLLTVNDFIYDVSNLIRFANPGNFKTSEIEKATTNNLFAELILKCKFIPEMIFREQYSGIIEIDNFKNIDAKPIMRYIVSNKYKKFEFNKRFRLVEK